MSLVSAENRIPEYEIATQFIERWSPRSFTVDAIPEATLFSFFRSSALGTIGVE